MKENFSLDSNQKGLNIQLMVQKYLKEHFTLINDQMDKDITIIQCKII